MASVSRRSFLTTATLAAAASTIPTRKLFASPQTPPIGLQLYSVREALAKDYPGTLKQVAAIGYREVEAAGFYNHGAAEVKQMMADAGLRCLSAHYSLADLLKTTDATIAYARTLGLEYVICSAPLAADRGNQHAMTLDDWKWNADQFNQMGCRMQEAGLKFGYHNDTKEFRAENGSSGYRVLLEDTDPRCVTLELDCGWAIAAGENPAKMLKQYPGRFSMLHVKDLKPPSPGTDPSQRISTEVGLGTVDFRPLFAAAKASGVRHYFVEQEKFDKPVFEALQIDFKNSTGALAGA